MDNYGVFANNINEYSILENLRNPRVLESQATPAAPREKQEDMVEISQQAFQLSQAPEIPSEERVSPASGAETAALNQNPQQVNIESNNNNGYGLQIQNGNIYSIYINPQSQQTNVQSIVTPEAEAAQAPAKQNTDDKPDLMSEQLNNSFTNSIQLNTESLPITTLENTSSQETTTTLIPENAENDQLAIIKSIEEATQLAQARSYNDLSNGSQTNSATSNVARDNEIAQYQDQTFLQTIGTQLAQAVPPASIFSFLA